MMIFFKLKTSEFEEKNLNNQLCSCNQSMNIKINMMEEQNINTKLITRSYLKL